MHYDLVKLEMLNSTAVRTASLASHGKQTKGTENNYKDTALVIQWKAIMQNITEIHALVIMSHLLPVQSNSKRFLMTLVVVSCCFLCSTSRILESFIFRWPTNANSGTRNSQNMSTRERSARSVIFGSQGTKCRKRR
jgi:hypothetical protein